jgi:hypothetical protein
MYFAKDGYQPGELVQIVIEVDNSQCKANVKTLTISVNNTVSMRSQGSGTSDHRSVFSKQINGLYAGESLTV